LLATHGGLTFTLTAKAIRVYSHEMAATTNEDDAFLTLVKKCVKAYSVVYNDTTALDSLGIIGKQRVLILEDDYYQCETRKLKAQRTLKDLKEVDTLLSSIDELEEEERKAANEPKREDVEEEDEEIQEEEQPPIDEYDIRGAIKKPKKKDKKPDKAKKPVGRPPGRPRVKFDKTKIETRLKLLSQRREIMDAEKGSEDREDEAMNIFFIPVTKEEFEKLSTVEISEGTAAKSEFEGTLSQGAKIAVGSRILKATTSREVSVAGFHYEENEMGEDIMVEDV